MHEKKINLAILFFCWLTYPFQRNSKPKDQQVHYEYYSVNLRSVSVDIGGIFQEYETESTSNNVRRNTATDVWEVFRRKYGAGGDTDYHQGMNGTWEILDNDKIEIIKKTRFYKTPQLSFG